VIAEGRDRLDVNRKGAAMPTAAVRDIAMHYETEGSGDPLILIPYLSAVKNVESALLYRGLSARERRARALAALDRVGLAARAHHRPMFLSGGEQQRVAIARAIVSDPALILADEPTGSLDSANAAIVLELLRSIAATGAAVVIVTHDEAIAAHASRQLVMLDGRLQHDSRRSAAA
jgi:putative ABC transport system ATP-binding protein